ncbi:uncharacterized protein LOC132564656 [Ylistrum balloti]|uniref:uncharacterized protein LOC132564656 n=1 Tax=Ylistrum balloti TaxID=509963 RepID=UPI002905D209|nr:uncharacterized protein LOC132564656 [Ylistrum balloti]
MLNLHFPSAAVFHRIQNFYIGPTVDLFWKEHQTELIESFAGKDIVLMGDGRMDSPGHSAQYCSYSLMEMETKKVLSLVTMDKRVVDRKSTTIEKEAFRRSIEELKAKGLGVKEVVTDAHMGIGYLMRTSYPEIKHSHDIWHVAKNLGKRITKAGQKKGCKDLLRWAKHIVNHFWYACREATGYMRFINIWGQVRHHACNEHEWILSEGEGPAECSHGDLEKDANRPDWLPKESLAAKAINEIVLDKRLRNSYGYIENFRMTAEIEVFNNLILMYCAKRFEYSPASIQAITDEALDNNCHIDRPLLMNKKGEVVYHRTFNKKSGRWSVYPCKVNKNYQHVRDLLRRMLSARLEDKMGMHRPKAMAADDPRRLSVHLSPVSPKATKELVSQQMIRKKETEK